MTSVYFIVHCDGSMNECHIERVTFTSTTPKVVVLERDITIQRMKEVIFKKLHRKTKEGCDNALPN